MFAPYLLNPARNIESSIDHVPYSSGTFTKKKKKKKAFGKHTPSSKIFLFFCLPHIITLLWSSSFWFYSVDKKYIHGDDTIE